MLELWITLTDAKVLVNQDWISFLYASVKDNRPYFGG
jgi:hypothetical protein